MMKTLWTVIAAALLLTGCGKDGAPAPEPSVADEKTEPVEKPEAPAQPVFWGEVSLHKALRDANPAYTGNGQFQINEQGQPEAIGLADCGVSSLEPLRGMPLKALDLKGCPVSDISPVAGMPLENLFLENTNVEDLSPLKGNTTLTELYLSATNVEDISPLKGLPIQQLNLVGCRVTDLTPLAGMPLQMLWLTDLPVTDISPLAQTPVISLTLHRSKVEDLTPLARTRLERLHIGETPVKDLTPLAGLPLTRLIFTPANIEKGIDAVRGMPSIREIGSAFEDGRDTRLAPTDFWAKYDAGEFK